MNNKIFVLTAVHNDLGDTKRLLESLFGQSFLEYEVFIVDDGSTDGTSKFIRKNYPQVNIIKGGGDLWWTASLNLGLKHILRKAKNTDYVWIINNDCYFDKGLFQVLINYKNKTTGNKDIIASVVLDSKTKKVIDAGVVINWNDMKFRPNGTDALSTRGTLFPVGVFKEVGLFDAKHFPHYFSDYEFTIRAKRYGYKLSVCGNCKIYNRSERTGIGEIPKKLRVNDIFNLLFSKKSKINLGLQINMVRYVCPRKLRLKNYFLLASKIINGAR